MAWLLINCPGACLSWGPLPRLGMEPTVGEQPRRETSPAAVSAVPTLRPEDKPQPITTSGNPVSGAQSPCRKGTVRQRVRTRTTLRIPIWEQRHLEAPEPGVARTHPSTVLVDAVLWRGPCRTPSGFPARLQAVGGVSPRPFPQGRGVRGLRT